jgi:phosphatidylinositol phospholipase C delta
MDPVPIPKEVQEVFSRYAHEDGKMDASKLLEFLHKEQGELKATLQEAEQLLLQQNQQQQQQQLIHSQELKIDDFFQLLCNGSLNAALYTAVHQDMTQPVSHYYIYTGHNSYLTGNQLNSDCSVVPIIDALRRGVRVIELDLWPTTDKENIEVLHGK